MSSLIAASKLTIPKPVHAVVPRPALLARLDEPTYRVGLVCAPAGFGKTAVLATWACDRPDRPAWLSCDVTDREPTRFWRGLLAALSEAWPGVGDDAAIELERTGSDSYELAISLTNDLGELAGPVAIVIDDFHLARPSVDVMAELVSIMPANVRLLIGSRVDLPFSLARHRVGGSLLEIRTDELRFAVEESAALLEANNVVAQPGELQRLQDLTEGWPAAIQLAALSLQRTTDRSGFLDAFASTDRGVTDFLVNEVLDRQPSDWVEFMYETSVLDQFDVGLCEDVTGREDAGVVLHELVAANLFVVPLDAAGEWFRYHHLFGAFLRARLKSRGREHLRAAHERADRALLSRGDVVGALRQASVRGDLETAATVVRKTMGQWMSPADVDMSAAAARYWLHEHGSERVGSDPEQVLEFVLAMIVSSGPDDAVQWFAKIEQAHADPSVELSAYLQAIWAEHHLHHGEPEEGLRRAHLAMAAVHGRPPDRLLYPLIHPMSVRARLDCGDVAGARAALDTVLGHPLGHAILDEVRFPGMRAWVAFLDGELVRAEQSARSALQRANDLDLPPHDPGRVFAGLALAGVLAERTDDRSAAELLDEVRDGVDFGRRPPFQCLVALQQAAFAVAIGDEEAAESHLTRARLLFAAPSPLLQMTFAIEAARQAVHFRLPTAAAAVDALDGSPAATMLRIKLALQNDDPDAAATLLERLPAPATVREQVEHGTLRALISLPRDLDSANRHLTSVLSLGERECFMRTITNHGPMVAKLLTSFSPDRASQRYVEQLIDVNGASTSPVRRVVPTALVEPLSARELTVLRYLGSRLTYREIAAALFVSLNTMKSHVRSVYRKLDVASRREAVEMGRQLRLI